MNNLKFRAWDKTAKKMSKVTAIDFSTKPFRVFYKAYGNENYFNQDAILMQSTGLFDKYGVEIYEGDILTDEGNFENDYWDYATIEFDKTDYTYYIHWKREEVCENITDCYKYTVTGNIYENKELIENKELLENDR